MQVRRARMVKMPTPTPTPIPSPVLGCFEALEEGAVTAIVVAGLAVLLVCAGPAAVEMDKVIVVFSTGPLAVFGVSGAVGWCGLLEGSSAP